MMTKIYLDNSKQKLSGSDAHIFSILKSITVMLGTLLFFISSTPTFASTDFQPTDECQAVGKAQFLIDEQTRAEVAVTGRTEYNFLRSTLDRRQRLTIESSLGYEEAANSCIWRISVFIDNNSESRRVLSQMYLVTREGKVEYTLNPEGEFVKVQVQK